MPQDVRGSPGKVVRRDQPPCLLQPQPGVPTSGAMVACGPAHAQPTDTSPSPPKCFEFFDATCKELLKAYKQNPGYQKRVLRKTRGTKWYESLDRDDMLAGREGQGDDEGAAGDPEDATHGRVRSKLLQLRRLGSLLKTNESLTEEQRAGLMAMALNYHQADPSLCRGRSIFRCEEPMCEWQASNERSEDGRLGQCEPKVDSMPALEHAAQALDKLAHGRGEVERMDGDTTEVMDELERAENFYGARD